MEPGRTQVVVWVELGRKQEAAEEMELDRWWEAEGAGVGRTAEWVELGRRRTRSLFEIQVAPAQSGCKGVGLRGRQ